MNSRLPTGNNRSEFRHFFSLSTQNEMGYYIFQQKLQYHTLILLNSLTMVIFKKINKK